ncbi:Lipolytic enzyme, G-D-S-L family precursor [Hyphomicrobium sulfonivorans]|uniref:Lipolytic enzyme, G-D-S-L family n=1 Tax=Hyphomicrobium sulfonivorans TaxID=121290 RepID=A0A109BCD8_HYPSL|nr:Lipolytic enzyme, G-D-S-L family precursor [Hyphomicrobium sulfonivorans]
MVSPAAANANCEAPDTLVRFKAPLPKFTAALADGKPVSIIALGSSSTQGVGASSPNASYPVKLQAELRRRFPGSSIKVENMGVGGQLATHMLKRIKKDVIARKPTLVIWQTGVNDALRGVPLDKFRATVVAGIEQMQQAGIDIVLLDMQYYPRSEKVSSFPLYLASIRQIAEQRGIPVLRRYAIMKHLVSSAQYTPQQLLAADGFHLSDTGYGCLGRIVAEALQDEVGDAFTPQKAVVQMKYPAEAAKRAGTLKPPLR